ITGCVGSDVSSGNYAGCQYTYNTTNGWNASTSGTIYGIYDMSGGALEYISTFFSLATTDSTANGTSIINALSKYKNSYVGYSDGTDGRGTTMFSKGDAMYETSVGAWSSDINWYGSTTGWNGDGTYYPDSLDPWIERGGHSLLSTTKAGLFGYVSSGGYNYDETSFRSVIIVDSNL
ncbi:MAG: hypothetical protein WC343_04430, partial [Bacilli bacterium]